MKTRFLFFLFIISLITSELSAQPPGYLGKRCFLDYSMEISLLTTQIKPLSNISHNFALDYVISRRIQIGINYGLFTPKFVNSLDNRFEDGILRGNAIGLNAVFYFKNSLAPIGIYIGGQYQLLKGTYKKRTGIDATVKTFNIGFIYGYRRVFFDRLVFHVSNGLYLGPDSDELGTSSFSTTGPPLNKLETIYSINFGIGVGILLF